MRGPAASVKGAVFEGAEKGRGGGESGPVGLTLKVDQAWYEALKGLGARTRRSTQDILLASTPSRLVSGLAALDAYLRESGAG